MPRPRKTRQHYRIFRTMTTRWRDNDVYGHMNNAVYYEYVDTCVNAWLIDGGGLDVPSGPVVGLVVETGCVFHQSIGFPDPVTAGLAARRVGNSSVTYEVGLFAGDSDVAAAEASFTHVYVDRLTRRPVPLPEPLRTALGRIAVT